MSLPDQTPRLPKLPFLVGDAILVVVAWFIVYQSDTPLTANAIAAVTACVAVGALLGVVPFLADYARKQDEALDDRQRGLESLARTVNTAAEQIGIAANGLNEITDLLHKNLKHAEQLPHKLQEKIAEFNAQLDNAREDDREELEKEIAELRSSETERLQAAAEKIHKSVGELTKLDTAAQKLLTERNEQAERARTAATKAQMDSAAALNEAVSAVVRTLGEAKEKALSDIETRLADRSAAAVAAIEASATAAVAKIAAPAPAAEPSPAPGAAPSGAPPEVAAPPRRPRKARREEAVAAEPTPANASAEPAAAPSAIEPATPPVAEPTAEPAVPVTEAEAATTIAPAATPEPLTSPEPADASANGQPAESTPPAAPESAAPEVPADSGIPAETATSSEPTEETAVTEESPSPAMERPARKRARKAAADAPNDLTLELGGGEFSSPDADDTPVTSSEVIERVISSDGATRLIATAYIGIGNRLFIRGEGPGLSWEKGVPLQFVSIGKWRWETSEATEPFQVKLYKNDELECSALGTLTLDPGHQQEVTAKF